MKIYPVSLLASSMPYDSEHLVSPTSKDGGGWYSHLDRKTDRIDGRDMLGFSKIETWGRHDTLLSPDMDGAQAVNTVYPVHGV